MGIRLDPEAVSVLLLPSRPTFHLFDMIRIFTAAEAADSILERKALADAQVPDSWVATWKRMFGRTLGVEQAVAAIIDDVRTRGDAALYEFGSHLDGIAPASLCLEQDRLEAAWRTLDHETSAAMQLAADRIRAFHERQPVADWVHESADGTLGQIVRPIERVGIYVPGGSAPLPSTLLMSAIPAQVAGVPELSIITPPAQPAGEPEPILLAAAWLAGVPRLYVSGGAQAIAALAYGTETVPGVDKIAGPGGLMTTEAKRQVYGQVGLDGLYGPTETMIVADETADPEVVAADLLAQAEHDVLASAILVTPSTPLAEAVQAAVGHALEDLPRAEIVAESLDRGSGIVLVDSLEEGLGVANRYAAEHLCLLVEDPDQWVDRVQHAGGVFMGHHSSEVLGDYVAGPSHVMPTNGSARFSSPLNVLDFVRVVSLFGLNEAGARRIGPAAARLAETEGLQAHARAVTARSRL